MKRLLIAALFMMAGCTDPDQPIHEKLCTAAATKNADPSVKVALGGFERIRADQIDEESPFYVLTTGREFFTFYEVTVLITEPKPAVGKLFCVAFKTESCECTTM